MPQTKAEAERTLYDELGGEAAIDAAVDKFYEKVLADERVNFFFDGVDMRRQARMQKGFLIFALGGPRRYTGKGMKVVHERLVKEKGLNDLREMEAMAVCQEIVLSLVDTLFGTEPKLPSSNKPSYRNLQLELWKRETKEQQKYDELVAEQLEVERKIESDREKQDEELAKLLARESRRRQREQELKDRELARRLHRVEATQQRRIEEQLRQESYCYGDDEEKQKRRKKKEKKKENKGNGSDENEKTAKEELEDEDLRLARKLQREELKKRDKALGIRVVQRIPRSSSSSSSSSSTTKPTKERKKDDRRKHSPSPPSLPEVIDVAK